MDYIRRSYAELVATPRGRAIATTVALIAMMLFVSVLAYFYFSRQSLRLDEAQSLWQSSRTPLSILAVVAEDVHVPLYHQLLHIWRLFVGDSVASARAMSLVFYLASIPAMYLLGKKLFNRSTGILGALLLSISPFMNWYGSEIRMYTLFTFLVLLNQYFFVQIWKGKQRDTWFGYAVTALFGVYVHYFFFLNLLAQVVFYFTHKKLFPKGSFKRFALSAVLLIAGFVPWLSYVYLIGKAGNQSPHLTAPSTVDLFNTFQQFFVGFLNNDVNTVFLSLWPLALLFGFLALERHRKIAVETEYLLLAIFIPIFIAFFGSFVIAPVFISRYLILTVPALYLALISLFSSFTPRISRIAKGALILLMLVMMVVEIMNPTAPVKEDYRAASSYIEAHAKAEDAVILSAPFTVYPFEYYYHGQAPVTTLPVWNQYAYGPIPAFIPENLSTDIASSTDGAQNVWLLLSYDQGYQETIQDYFDTHYQRLYKKQFSPDLILQVYKLRYDTPISETPLSFPN